MHVAFPPWPFAGVWNRERELLPLRLPPFSKAIGFWCCQSDTPSLAPEKLVNVTLCTWHWKPCKDAALLPSDFFSFLSLLLCCQREQKEVQLISVYLLKPLTYILASAKQLLN